MRGQVLMLDGWEVRLYTNIPSPCQPLDRLRMRDSYVRGGPACLDCSVLHSTRRFLPLPTWWMLCLCTWVCKSTSQQTRSKQGVLPQVLGRSLELKFGLGSAAPCDLLSMLPRFCAAWTWGATEVSLQTLQTLRLIRSVPAWCINFFTRVWWQYSCLLTWWNLCERAWLLTLNRCLQLISQFIICQVLRFFCRESFKLSRGF
jgi:hypothetical protein